MKKYHWRDGVFFERLSTGHVVIDHTEDGALMIPPEEWARIVAHVSAFNGSAEGYHAAEMLHAGLPPEPLEAGI